jgi:1,4-alpha-glucan branching enzyme
MSIKKQHLKSRPVCRVTFRFPSEAAENADSVHIVGEFNGWDRQATPMRKLKNGSFMTTLDLDPGREYQFRYLIDGKKWENDWAADNYTPTPFGMEENSVIVV